jgi:hypothetical protein
MNTKKLHRRSFIKNTGIMATGLMALRHPGLKAAAKRYLPNTGLYSAQWVESLYKRGSVTTYLKSKNELKYIGMR